MQHFCPGELCGVFCSCRIYLVTLNSGYNVHFGTTPKLKVHQEWSLIRNVLLTKCPFGTRPKDSISEKDGISDEVISGTECNSIYNRLYSKPEWLEVSHAVLRRNNVSSAKSEATFGELSYDVWHSNSSNGYRAWHFLCVNVLRGFMNMGHT